DPCQPAPSGLLPSSSSFRGQCDRSFQRLRAASCVRISLWPCVFFLLILCRKVTNLDVESACATCRERAQRFHPGRFSGVLRNGKSAWSRSLFLESYSAS